MADSPANATERARAAITSEKKFQAELDLSAGIGGRASRQQKRKRIEEIFGRMKTVGGMRKLRHRGLELVGWMFALVILVNLDLTPRKGS